MTDLGPAVLTWCALSLAVAGLVKGVTGIGIPLVSISLLTVFLSVPQAVLLLPVPIILANVWQSAASGYFLATCRRFWMLLVGLGAGMASGAALLTRVDQAPLLVVLGAVVLTFCAMSLMDLRLRIPARSEAFASTVAGVLGGLLGGVSTMFGPPIVMLLVSLRLQKEAFVGTVSTLYLLCGVIMTVAFAGYGVFDLTQALWSGAAAGPLFLGMLAGNSLRRRVSEAAFRRALLGLLLLVGANLVRRGVSGG